MRRTVLAALLAASVAAAPAYSATHRGSSGKQLSPAAGGRGSSAAASSAPSRGFVEESIQVPVFGKVTVYRPDPLEGARGVILFVSGDGGWNKGVVDMGRRSAARAVVVGLSMPQWQKIVEKEPARCWYPAGELETIAQAVEKKLGLPRYLKPILVGYSSGATVVYGALAQAPSETFAGAVSLGFCPDLEVRRPLCSLAGWKPSYDAKKKLSLLPEKPDLAPRAGGGARWLALQGDIDKVCDPPATDRFIASIPAAKVYDLPKVGHGFSVPRHWGSAYDDAVASLLETTSPWEPLPETLRHVVVNRSPAEIQERLDALDLPLEVEWPGAGEPPKEAIIFVSGDGGWADIDQHVAAALFADGVGVVGWNSLRYFWTAKSPGTFRGDLARVIEALPPGLRIFAGGFSFGAEVVPTGLASREERGAGPLARITGLVLLGPGRYASFEVSPLDWLRTADAPSPFGVREAIGRAAGMPILCMAGADEKETGCPVPAPPGVSTVLLPGGHHFGGNYEELSGRILRFMRGGADQGLTDK